MHNLPASLLSEVVHLLNDSYACVERLGTSQRSSNDPMALFGHGLAGHPNEGELEWVKKGFGVKVL